MMYQILLLDIDGTLLDFQKSQKITLEKTFQAFDYPLTEETKCLYEKINHGLWKQYERGEITRETVIYRRFERLFKEIGIQDDGIAFENTYQELLGQSAILLDGALELVQYLYQKYDLYVITNGVTRTQKQRLKDSGLDRYMKDIFISGEIGAQKPQKEFFDVCLERMGDSVEKSSMLIIGDTLSSDILGGIHAGIDTCWYNPEGLAAAPKIPSTYTVGSFPELMELL